MEGEGFMTGKMWRPVLAPLGGARSHKMTSQGFKEVPFVAGRADHGDGPQSPSLPVGLHPEHHQRGALGGPDVSQVRNARAGTGASERASEEDKPFPLRLSAAWRSARPCAPAWPSWSTGASSVSGASSI